MSSFLSFRRLGGQLKPKLGHNPGIDALNSCGEFVWVISIVEQNGNLRDVDRLGTEVINVGTEQFDHALVIGDIGFGAVGKKRKAQGIDGQMALDTIGAFVMTETF